MRRFIFSLLFFGFTCLSISQNETDVFCTQMERLNVLLEENHFSPKTLNDAYSEELFAFFLELLDEKKSYLAVSEVESLKKHELKLDDYIQNGECSFIEEFSTAFENSLIRAKKMYDGLRDTKMEYTGKDSITYYAINAEREYLTNVQLADYYTKKIKYSTLYAMVEADTSLTAIVKNFSEKETVTRAAEIDKAICSIDEILTTANGVLGYTQDAFLNAMCMYQDPHTMFFTPSVKQDFENSLSTTYESFGLYMSKNSEGEFVVGYIIPGSAAFKNGKIEEGDIVTSITSNGDTLSLTCVSEIDANQFINSEEHSKVQFELKKKDGAILLVNLLKTELSLQENLTTGYILGTDPKIGYIEVNSFYTDMDSPFGLGVANDVAKELHRLNRENVAALILDLRFNGGGSLKEAADLSGMFIDRGELAIFKQFDGNTYSLKDYNRGTLFKKPLLIMVNEQSASASELFAAAMQDYQRAIVVGSTTHGKGSSQTVLPLDEENPDLGFAKVTIERFDRISETGIQSVGVHPDIKLPSLGDGLQGQEKYLPFALQPEHGEIPIAVYHNTSKYLHDLRKKSIGRVAQDTMFKVVKAANETLIKEYVHKAGRIPISLQAVYNEHLVYTKIWEQLLDESFAPTQNIPVANYAELEELLLFDNDRKEINELVRLDISKDPYIIESYTILNDYITLTQK